jgi:hypothetical protein
MAMRSAITLLLAALLCPKPAAAQLAGQSFTVIPDTAAATVGDSVTVRFRIGLHERDQLLDTIPQVAGDLPPGVRVLSIEKLTRSPDRVYHGSARIAFYRPGPRPVPVFDVAFMRVTEGISRASLPSDSAFVEISAVLPPAGNPALKDIREIEKRPASTWPWFAAVAALLAAAALYRRFSRKAVALTPVVEPDSPAEPPPPSAYEVALAWLDRVEGEHWPGRGQVELHYQAIAQTLRQYLDDAHDIGALERTTSELLWAIPPQLGRGGLRDQCHDILTEADLVKFAEMRPSIAAAGDFLARARRLLAAWHTASLQEGMVDAIR